ncbi:MAG: hypothetical protein KDD82_16520 [Planctomycetes bacterium]|nr:hypothetical protein [Planctomycetota bacterium]
MKIMTISYSGSNPSMGPHDSSSSRTLNMERFQDELNDLLDHTQVNGAVSLREYLSLRRADDHEGVRKVHESFDCGDLAEGARIIDLEFRFQDGPTIALKDLRRFSLQGSGFENFDELIKAKGTVSTFSVAGMLEAKEVNEFEVPEVSDSEDAPVADG